MRVNDTHVLRSARTVYIYIYIYIFIYIDCNANGRRAASAVQVNVRPTCSSTSAASANVTSGVPSVAASSAAFSQPAREKMKTIAGSMSSEARQRSTDLIDGTSALAAARAMSRCDQPLPQPRLLSDLLRPPSMPPSRPPTCAPPLPLRRPLPPFPPKKASERPPLPSWRFLRRSRSAWRRCGWSFPFSFQSRMRSRPLAGSLPPGPAPLRPKSGSIPSSSAK